MKNSKFLVNKKVTWAINRDLAKLHHFDKNLLFVVPFSRSTMTKNNCDKGNSIVAGESQFYFAVVHDEATTVEITGENFTPLCRGSLL